MSSIRLDIISIGTLSRNMLWKEAAATRSAHATTSLIRVGKRNILVDPALPPQALAARLNERTGLKPDQIDTVFLTNFRPAHRGGVSLFTKAKAYIHEIEQQAARQQLERLLAESEVDDQRIIESELNLLESLKPSPDKLAEQLDLFPLFGYTPGQCGLIVAGATNTTIIAGDAVPTQDHFLAGQTLPDAWDIKAAHEAMSEVYEIADLIVPGHDNNFLNPRTMGM
ncbi:MAG TPA: MBL fold metallo-hydrolase [Tepidisphaeraceae bacterium]|jgi:glyoxylase-like metal-dependent hydrolase (beta-lactamase superfamily II)|nr:MBL fold metallo-hydrolase [Tepidisphaeraceae bacterium]